jgi:hypothetical protein
MRPAALGLLVLVAIVLTTILACRQRRRASPEPQPAALAARAVPSPEADALSRTHPLVVSLHGSLFRYQATGHLHHGADFYKVFLDGAWKWQGQQRYAGVYVDRSSASDGKSPVEYKINVGHYFARGLQGARAEILHYTTKEELARNFAVMEIEADLDNVLDLTDLQVIRTVASATYITGTIWDILAALLGEETGGGDIPTAFGYYASRHHHTAILTFSARALRPDDAARLRESQFWDDVMEDIVKTDIVETMQRQTNRQCVVVLSGSLLTRLVKRYRYDDGPWETNPLFGASAEEIDKLWGQFGPDFQATQGRVAYLEKHGSPDHG